jgi:hypothetical protein
LEIQLIEAQAVENTIGLADPATARKTIDNLIGQMNEMQVRIRALDEMKADLEVPSPLPITAE